MRSQKMEETAFRQANQSPHNPESIPDSNPCQWSKRVTECFAANLHSSPAAKRNV